MKKELNGFDTEAIFDLIEDLLYTHGIVTNFIVTRTGFNLEVDNVDFETDDLSEIENYLNGMVVMARIMARD